MNSISISNSISMRISISITVVAAADDDDDAVAFASARLLPGFEPPEESSENCSRTPSHASADSRLPCTGISAIYVLKMYTEALPGISADNSNRWQKLREPVQAATATRASSSKSS